MEIHFLIKLFLIMWREKMNKFQEVKRQLTNEQVARRYLGVPEKQTSTGLWYKSPFRQERTASFCVSKKGIHDFGSSEHYDMIAFVERYFNVTPNQAIDLLCQDFGLTINNPYRNKQATENLKKKREEEQEIKRKVSEWYSKEMQKACEQLQDVKSCIKVLERTTYFEALGILYSQEVRLEIRFEILSEIAKDEQKQTKMYLEEL